MISIQGKTIVVFLNLDTTLFVVQKGPKIHTPYLYRVPKALFYVLRENLTRTAQQRPTYRDGYRYDIVARRDPKAPENPEIHSPERKFSAFGERICKTQ